MYSAVEIRPNWWAVVDEAEAIVLGALSQVTAHDLAERFESAYQRGRSNPMMSRDDWDRLDYVLSTCRTADAEWLECMQARVRKAMEP